MGKTSYRHNLSKKEEWSLALCVYPLRARARVCVCLRPFYPACVCLRPFTVTASSVGNNWNAKEQIKNVALKTFLSSAKSLHFYFRLKHQTFLTSPLSCSHTRSRQSHDLAIVCISLSKHKAFIYEYQALPSLQAKSQADLPLASGTTEGGCNLTMKG